MCVSCERGNDYLYGKTPLYEFLSAVNEVQYRLRILGQRRERPLLPSGPHCYLVEPDSLHCTALCSSFHLARHVASPLTPHPLTSTFFHNY